MPRNNWSRDELMVAFNLYCKLGFTNVKYTNLRVINLSKLIDRTPSAVAYKLVNFARLDPELQSRGVKGMSHGSKGEVEIWDEFINNKEDLLFESERILALFENKEIEEKYSGILRDISVLEGKTRLREVKTRVNQQVFRQIILSSYSSKCAISGIDIPELLIASHIIPWSVNEKERLNPENGICLSLLYDTAFDKGFLALDNNYKIVFSKHLKKYSDKSFYNYFFEQFENKVINIPAKYPPNKDFLKYHFESVFRN